MSLVVTPLLNDIDLAESATPWTTGSLDPDRYVQGSNSIGWYSGKNARSVNGVSSKSIAHAAGDHLYWWNSSDVISKAEAQTTGTTTASGVTIRVTLSDGAYREWHVAGSDTWDGGWRCFVVDLSHTGTHLYASSGTWSTANNITDVDIYIDLSNSGNIRNVPANQYSDAIRVGTGLQVHNTSAADASFDLLDIALQDAAVANRWGILEIVDGVIFCQGEIVNGDSASTNHLDFDSQDEVFVFSQRDGTDGYGLVADTLYEMSFTGNATGTDQDVNFGIKVGTGDTASGRNGTLILAGGAAVEWLLSLATDADLHNVTVYGSTFRGAFQTGATYGVDGSTGPTTTYEFIGNTIDDCGQAALDDAVVRNVNFLNTQAAATEGALLWENGTTDAKNCLFVNNAVGVEIQTLAADVNFDGMEFSGNTNDVRYEGTTDWDLNWTNATGAPSIQNSSTGTLTAVNTVTLTLLNVVVGSQCSIHADPGGTELMNEAAISSTVTEAYAYSAAQDVIVRVRKASADPKYKPYDTPGQITSDGLTVFVSQAPA